MTPRPEIILFAREANNGVHKLLCVQSKSEYLNSKSDCLH